MYTPLFFYIAALVISSTLGCSGSAKKEDTDAVIFQRFHGRYKVVASVSSEAVDINMDGVRSTDIKSEIPELATAELALLIRRDYMYFQLWPEQSFASAIEPASYDPNVVVNYENHGVGVFFHFDKDLKEIQVDTTVIDPRFTRPDMVLVKP